MIGLNTLAPAEGAKHRRKIVGRGESSGHGKTSTRGHKGQKARSGDGKMSWFEGGQMSIVRRTPKRGFSHAMFRKEYEIVNLSTIIFLQPLYFLFLQHLLLFLNLSKLLLLHKQH